MSHLLHFAVLIACCLAAVRPLARARWVQRMPRTALVLWQAVGVTFELSLIGLLLSAAFAPHNQGLIPGLVQLATGTGTGTGPGAVAAGLGALCALARAAALALACREVAGHRRRHRDLLALVARAERTLPGVEVLDHPAAAAYCLPGRPGRVVVTTGALRVLDGRRLAAVIAHERAHLRQRHDLVLLPLLSWRRLVPRNPLLEEAVAAARLLLEMCADDASCRRCPPQDLATALTRFSAADGGFAVPRGGYSAAGAGSAVGTRTARLLAPPPGAGTAAARVAVCLAAAALLSTPVSLFILPL